MTNEEALIYVKMCCSDGLQLPQNQSLEQVKLIGASIETIEKDLDRLGKLEKAIEIILKYKIRPSIFVLTIKNYREMYGKDLTLEKAYILLDFCGTQEEYELLKEVLEDE